jgi:hypothetical protein
MPVRFMHKRVASAPLRGLDHNATADPLRGASNHGDTPFQRLRSRPVSARLISNLQHSEAHSNPALPAKTRSRGRRCRETHGEARRDPPYSRRDPAIRTSWRHPQRCASAAPRRAGRGAIDAVRPEVVALQAGLDSWPPMSRLPIKRGYFPCATSELCGGLGASRGASGAVFELRALRRSTITNKAGMKKIPSSVAASMPEMTTVPIT